MSIHLNQFLIKKQKLNDNDIAELIHLHELMERVMAKLELLESKNPDDLDTMHLLSDLVESLEYNMQRVWKFEQDSEFHTWWYKLPHCTCPKLDNADPIYIYKHIDANCPLHGKRKKQLTL